MCRISIIGFIHTSIICFILKQCGKIGFFWQSIARNKFRQITEEGRAKAKEGPKTNLPLPPVIRNKVFQFSIYGEKSKIIR